MKYLKKKHNSIIICLIMRARMHMCLKWNVFFPCLFTWFMLKFVPPTHLIMKRLAVVACDLVLSLCESCTWWSNRDVWTSCRNPYITCTSPGSGTENISPKDWHKMVLYNTNTDSVKKTFWTAYKTRYAHVV